jgi:hypothetical protein
LRKEALGFPVSQKYGIENAVPSRQVKSGVLGSKRLVFGPKSGLFLRVCVYH